MSEKYELKYSLIGPDKEDEKETSFLGRRITWEKYGLTWTGDENLVMDLIKEWDLWDAKEVETAGVTEHDRKQEDTEEEMPMDSVMAARYRSAAAKLNYASLDNPRIVYASKEICRKMANPMKGDEVKLKRVLRFLKGMPVSRYVYAWQEPPKRLDGHADSDWAGCRKTRRSTSGGAIMHGMHLVAHWSRTQVGVALSSCEAELNASLKMGSEIIGLVQTLREWGVYLDARILGDSSPLQGLLERRGVGRIKHLAMKQLWLQGKVREKTVSFEKVPRENNPSDAMTHHWTKAEGLKHFCRLGVFAINRRGSRVHHEVEGGC